jgi:hypothetical protein
VIDAASSEDLLKIVKACFPMLEPVAPKLTGVYTYKICSFFLVMVNYNNYSVRLIGDCSSEIKYVSLLIYCLLVVILLFLYVFMCII